MAEYFAASLGAFLIIFFELLSTHSRYTIQAIFNIWGIIFLSINILAGVGIYFIYDSGILQAFLVVEPQGLNIFLLAFIIGASFPVLIRSKLTLLRLGRSDSVNKVDLSTPWDVWHETIRDYFYEKIDEVVRKSVFRDVDNDNLRTNKLKDNCSVQELSSYLENFITHCKSPRIKQKIEEAYDKVNMAASNNQKNNDWLHLRLAAIAQEYISDDKFNELTEKLKIPSSHKDDDTLNNSGKSP